VAVTPDDTTVLLEPGGDDANALLTAVLVSLAGRSFHIL